jgi:tetratricopeptide (TPR) repeat protein
MDASGGVFIMFSAGAKQEALDRLNPGDPEKTSVFVRSFVPLIPRNDMTLIDIAKETQERVRGLASSVGHEQIPAYYDGIVGRVTLTGAPTVATPVTKADVVAARQPEVAAVRPTEAAPTRAPEVNSPEIEACDRAAASPRDPDKPANVPGVEPEALAAQAGILACRKAVDIPGAPRRVFFQLGRSYGKLNNYRDAIAYYIKAVDLKHPVAMHNLAALNAEGKGVARDYSNARVLYESAAAAGIDESLNQVGRLYEMGLGAPRDYGKALYYYRKAVEAGNAAANSRLGAMYVNGLGVPRDNRKACELFRAGATMGSPDAATNARKFCGR